jgi:phosphonate transport system substrate-binding protein
MIRIASCMAPNADDTCRAIAAYIARKLGQRTEFVDGISWRERERQFDAGEIQLCWLCGLPYVWKADTLSPAIELVAAPVMLAPRYAGMARYFSDVVVHAHSRYQAFDELRGASWAYNETNSHSGYNVVRHHLNRLGESSGYFGTAIESGAHQVSLRMIINRDIDAAAIDSTVLENELARAPDLRRDIRVIDTLGPSPMPPWVMRAGLPHAMKQALRTTFLQMHADEAGFKILQSWGIARFDPVDDVAYDPIRLMAAGAEKVQLTA